jgi:hypothetical protein
MSPHIIGWLIAAGLILLVAVRSGDGRRRSTKGAGTLLFIIIVALLLWFNRHH